jgi:protein-S-isoprenylcysteine O-methyltransferase Ste14
MLDIAVIRILSIFLAAGMLFRLLWFGFNSKAFLPKRKRDLGKVKTSKPTGFVLHEFWLLLQFLPFIFYLLGAIVPDWVYGTILNVSFGSAEYLQIASVLIFLLGAFPIFWSERTLGQLMGPRVEVLEKQVLVTTGPYSRIRHPLYTGIMLLALAPVLLFLNIVPVVAFFACVGIAYKKAVLEEELLASEKGFGQEYKDYMLKTGRFLPKLRRGN